MNRQISLSCVSNTDDPRIFPSYSGVLTLESQQLLLRQARPLVLVLVKECGSLPRELLATYNVDWREATPQPGQQRMPTLL